MYATAHRVVGPSDETGTNAFLHKHGIEFVWPTEPWRLPETNPGVQVWEHVELTPGKNRVRAYLDVLAPDDTAPTEIDVALTGLWLELVADETGPVGLLEKLPNPVVYQRGRVVLRFGVELELMPNRAIELAELRQIIDPTTTSWHDTSSLKLGSSAIGQ